MFKLEKENEILKRRIASSENPLPATGSGTSEELNDLRHELAEKRYTLHSELIHLLINL